MTDQQCSNRTGDCRCDWLTVLVRLMILCDMMMLGWDKLEAVRRASASSGTASPCTCCSTTCNHEPPLLSTTVLYIRNELKLYLQLIRKIQSNINYDTHFPIHLHIYFHLQCFSNPHKVCLLLSTHLAPTTVSSPPAVCSAHSARLLLSAVLSLFNTLVGSWLPHNVDPYMHVPCPAAVLSAELHILSLCSTGC